jgi:transposase-like protein
VVQTRRVTGSRHDRQFWERAVREVERCGSVGDVARRLGVQARTLTWWRWRIRREGAAKLAKRAEFIPVVMAAGATASSGMVEVDAGVARVRVEAGIDVEYVAALVKALRSSC